MIVGRALTNPQAVVPAPPLCTTTETLLKSHSAVRVKNINAFTYGDFTVWTIPEVKCVGSVCAVASQFAPATRDDDTHPTSSCRFDSDIGQSLKIINDYATKTNVDRR